MEDIGVEATNVNQVPQKVWMISCIEGQLGKGIAERALQDGDMVVVGKCSDSEDLERAFPGTCATVTLSAKNRSLSTSAVAQAVKRFGRIDVLVNHASCVVVAPLLEVSEALFREQIHKSLHSTVNMIHAALPIFYSQHSGHIINVTDVCGEIGTPSLSVWTAAVRGIEGYTESLGLSLASQNIKTTVVRTSLEVTMASVPVKFPTVSEIKGTNRPQNLVEQSTNLLKGLNSFPVGPFEEAIHGIISIAGIKDPPSFVPVGVDAMGQIREKLSQVSEDLDEYQSNQATYL